jgi:catechol 2,3-dioxygenase-like lactoylglutathione lyase family enzyme
MEIQLSMVGIPVRDMAAALAFYRLLGVPIADGQDASTFVMHRMGSGVSLFFRARSDDDPAGEPRPADPLLEFYVGDDAAVDAAHARLTAAGHRSLMPPTQTPGPYAATIADPDGNTVLITSDEAGRIGG